MTGSELKALRKQRGLTLARGAMDLGVSVETLARWERSEQLPHWRQFDRILQWQCVTFDRLPAA